MRLPRYIDPKVSLGSIMAVVAVLVGFLTSYGITEYKLDEQVKPQVEQNRKDIDTILRSNERVLQMLQDQKSTLEKIDNRLYNLVEKKNP